jgi:demethylmenaquinone methyltransferase/2-methoxy-6-polyprenyl-1,4-benzoquinol methylase
MRAMFDRVATRYDLLNTLCSLGLHKRWRKVAMRFCANRNGRALDLCTGTGDWAIALRENGALVVGLDVSPRMLGLARQKMGPSARLVMGDALRLPFADACFDLVTIGFSLRNVRPLAVLFEEVKRVLRPDGVFVSLELTRPTAPTLALLHRLYLRAAVPALGKLSAVPAYRYLADSILEFPSAEEVAAQLTQAGLNDVRFVPLTGGIATVHVASVGSHSAGKSTAEEQCVS